MVHELKEYVSLYYVGISRHSGEVHKSWEETFAQKEEDIIKNLNNLKSLTIKIKDCILTNNLEMIGKLLHESWENKKKLSKNISNPVIDNLYEIGLNNGVYGGKLLGAGGGGYLLLFHPSKKRNQIKKALENSGGQLLDFNFEFGGTKIWTA